MAEPEKSEKKRRSIQGLTLDQLRRRRWMQSRGRWIAGVAAMVVLAIVAIWLLYFSSVFAVKHVTVTGTSVCTNEEAQQLQATADSLVGSPLIDADLAKVRKEADSLSCVASVSVKRSWPQTVTVEVTTRTAVAVVQTAAGLRTIDPSGVIFGRRLAQRRSLPLIILSGQVDRSALSGAATAAASLPATILRQVTSITVQTMDSIQLNLTRGRQVFWGDAADSAIKAQVAALLLRHGNNIIDVSIPSHPATG